MICKRPLLMLTFAPSIRPNCKIVQGYNEVDENLIKVSHLYLMIFFKFSLLLLLLLNCACFTVFTSQNLSIICVVLRCQSQHSSHQFLLKQVF